MPKKYKVLILHTSVGHGIRIIAENIYCELQNQALFEVRIADLYEVAPGSDVTILEKIYFFFTEKFPFIWGLLYSEIVAPLMIPFRLPLASLRYQKIWKLIREYEPDIVVSTETVPSGIVSYLKRQTWYQGKLVIAFSDYHLHRFWLYDQADLYLCVTAEQVGELQALGISRNKIALTGMMVAEKFFRKIPRTTAARTFGLNPDLPTVLLSGGRRGLLVSKELIEKLSKNPRPFHIVVVTGLNEKLKRELEELPSSPHHNLKILGYVQDQDILMSAVDMMITKPGGPTIAEAIAKNLPVVITDTHPGHESKNMEYLSRHEIAWSARSPEDASRLTEKILKGEIQLDRNRAYSKILKPPDSLNITAALIHLRFSSPDANIKA